MGTWGVTLSQGWGGDWTLHCQTPPTLLNTRKFGNGTCSSTLPDLDYLISHTKTTRCRVPSDSSLLRQSRWHPATSTMCECLCVCAVNPFSQTDFDILVQHNINTTILSFSVRLFFAFYFFVNHCSRQPAPLPWNAASKFWVSSGCSRAYPTWMACHERAYHLHFHQT